ncbi:sigma-54 dependent transcriptional regulator [Burkholderiaceae bacterium DAT-1]|nr:sigma-54 dependent transcriptional regulator [Burkholderiaceae bacterium DAT-1]
MTDPILICDDDVGIRAALKLFFKSENWPCEVCASPDALLDALRQHEASLVLVDLNYTRDTTSGLEGLDLIRELRREWPDLPIIAMTAWSTVQLAVEAMRLGASDFIEKPWDNQRLGNIVRQQLRMQASQHENIRLKAENRVLQSSSGAPDWIGESTAMQAVISQASSVAGADVNILITGENGTGKSQLAEWIHAHSRRAQGSLVRVNMGAIPDSLFESELFGHKKGAFTDAKEDRMGRFELAEGGTLFLDEIGNLPLNQQAKLLQVLETRQFERLGSSRPQHANVRLITATNADLPALVTHGRFRQDLLYRLNSIVIHMPPLRERHEDIPLLARHFLHHHARQHGKPLRELDVLAIQVLQSHSWPGNVRELSHCMERAALLATGAVIQAGDLGLAVHGPSTTTPADDVLDSLSLEDAEKWLIRMALKRHDGNAQAAAEALGLSRSAFYRRLQKFGL